LMRITLSAAAFASLSLPLPASAAEPEACPGLVASRETLFSRATLRQDEVGLTFVGHATFLIETPQGVKNATDYSDGIRPRHTATRHARGGDHEQGALHPLHRPP
jgi:hypothetical protein